jgi:hypothetical protein
MEGFGSFIQVGAEFCPTAKGLGAPLFSPIEGVKTITKKKSFLLEKHISQNYSVQRICIFVAIE